MDSISKILFHCVERNERAELTRDKELYWWKGEGETGVNWNEEEAGVREKGDWESNENEQEGRVREKENEPEGRVREKENEQEGKVRERWKLRERECYGEGKGEGLGKEGEGESEMGMRQRERRYVEMMTSQLEERECVSTVYFMKPTSADWLTI